MSRYIDADAVEQIIENAGTFTDGEYCGYYTDDINAIYNLPSADVAEIKRGRWEVDDIGIKVVATCSVCRNEIEMPTCLGKPIYSYCPACGAKMDEVEE